MHQKFTSHIWLFKKERKFIHSQSHNAIYVTLEAALLFY